MELTQRLQTQLSPMHQWLEKAPLATQLLSPHLTWAEYTQLLTCFYQVIAPFEKALQAVSDDFYQAGLVDIEPRLEKTQWLQSDLASLAPKAKATVGPPSGEVGLGLVGSAPLSAAAGALYVLEGATLGAQIILPKVKKTLGDAVPVRFYAGYGDHTQARWQSLCVWLNQSSLDPHEAVLAGAEVFLRLRQSLVGAP